MEHEQRVRIAEEAQKVFSEWKRLTVEEDLGVSDHVQEAESSPSSEELSSDSEHEHAEPAEPVVISLVPENELTQSSEHGNKKGTIIGTESWWMIPKNFEKLEEESVKNFGHASELWFCKEVVELKELKLEEEEWRKTTLYLAYKYLEISADSESLEVKLPLLSRHVYSVDDVREKIFHNHIDAKIFDILVWHIVSELGEQFGQNVDEFSSI